MILVNLNKLRAFTYGKKDRGKAYGFNWLHTGIDYGVGKSYALFTLWIEGQENWYGAEVIDGRSLQEMAELIAVHIPQKDLYAEYKRWAEA